MVEQSDSYIEVKSYGRVVRISHPHSDRVMCNEVWDGWFDDFVSIMQAIGFSNPREAIKGALDEE